jgi:hypothetical protein
LFQLIASLALLAGLVIPTAAAAGASGNGGQAGHSGKKGHGKKKPGKGLGDDIDCSAAAKECHVDITLREASVLSGGGGCGSFDNAEGFCVGPTHGTNGWDQTSYFPKQGIDSSFTWKSHGGPARDVDYTADASALIVDAYVRGVAQASNSNVLNVTDAWNRNSNTHWRTVPNPTGKVGYPGGPMGIDYDHKTVGSSVHLWGFFVRK